MRIHVITTPRSPGASVPRAVRRTAVLVAVTALGAGTLTGLAAPASAEPVGRTYYVDSSGGHDTARGTSPALAWKSLGKVDATTFRPGDHILFKAGGRWTGQLWPKGSGSSHAPITLGEYGKGAKPAIEGAGTVPEAVRLWNQQYWRITGLDISNTAPASATPGANLADFRGIRVGGDDGTALHGFTIDGVNVHDITGEVNWIGGSTSGNKPGINFATGWDRSKNTGGIVFEPGVADPAAPGATATTLHDITVENSSVQNASFGGIVFKQYAGNDAGAVSTGWGTRTGPDDPEFTPNTDIVVRHNYLTQSGTPYGTDGIYITGSSHAVIEDNVIDHVGTSGIESYYTDDVTIQHNEVFGTTVKAGGGDSNAIDTDIGSTDQTVQYNYIADNGEGVLVYQQQFGDSVWRYNVLVGNIKDAWHISNAASAHGQIYGNTVYDTSGQAVVSSNGGTYTMTDNVFFSTNGAAATSSAGLAYDHNLYQGTAVPTGDRNAVVGDPQFRDPRQGKDVTGIPRTNPDLTLADGYAPSSGSPAVDRGVAVADNGGRDYAGSRVYNGLPDIGAFEYSTPVHAKTESVTGLVTESTAGHPVPRAKVRVSGTRTAVVTGADGRYVVKNVPFQKRAVLTVTRDGYTTSSSAVAVSKGNETTANVSLVPATSAGPVTGTVLGSSGEPLPGATVTVTGASGETATATTGSDGSFSVAGVPGGSGYTVSASAAGYATATRNNVTVVPVLGADIGVLGLSGGTPHTTATHDFDDLAVGPLADGADGLTVSTGGGTVSVDPSPSGGNQATLTRTSNSGTTGLSQLFPAGLAGVVTIDQDIMRDTTASGFFGAPYVRNSTGGNVISVGFNNGVINTYVGSTVRNVGTYKAGQWVHVRVAIDTFTQTYDLFLDGAQVLDDAALRNPLDRVTTVTDYADGGNTGTLHVDNVLITQGGPA